MHKTSGNFLLQALLALTLIIAFLPFFTQKLINRNSDAEMYAVANQATNAQTAARIYLRENINNINYNITIINGDDFADTLEPYGLPLGFVPRTAFGQDVSLVINKTPDNVFAYLELFGGDLTELQRAELVKRIGFYASHANGNVYVIVPLTEVFSDIVRRNEKNDDNNGFLSDLDMGGFAIENIGTLFGRNGEIETLQTNELSLLGVENGRDIRNKIGNMITNRATFQTTTGAAALNITRGDLRIGELAAKTIAGFGDTGNLSVEAASVYDFSMMTGGSDFVGPSKWEIRGNVKTDRITLNVERLDISSYINASRGQDVSIISDTVEYETNSGMNVGIIRASNITLRDQTSAALLRGGTGAVVLDIRVAGTSVLPDVLLNDISNDTFVIINDAANDGADTTDCKSVIGDFNAYYDSKSLAQNIICQYVFWHRLEQRIDIKQCLLDGGSNCE